MLTILLIIAFVAYIKYMDHLKDNAIDHYDMRKVDTTKLTNG